MLSDGTQTPTGEEQGKEGRGKITGDREGSGRTELASPLKGGPKETEVREKSFFQAGNVNPG